MPPSNLSTSLINKAGNTLSGRSLDIDEDRAWEILDEWRAAHGVPLHFLYINLSRHASKVEKNALIARRLKRSSSIFSKLQREARMSLRRMQDIAGCRAIMPSLQGAIALSERFQKSSQKHQLERVKNYIKSPKSSGYRGIHLIYRFKSNDSKYESSNDLRVEIQIRSMYQHLWATAVEIVAMMTQQALKSSQGSDDWLDFFRMIGSAFAHLDEKKIIPDRLCRDITKLAKKLDVQKRLTGYSLAMEEVKKRKADFYLLIIEKLALRIEFFSDADLANDAYLIEERRLKLDKSSDVVLVGADSFHQLRRAFPNYFGDSEKFVRALDAIVITRKKWWEL